MMGFGVAEWKLTFSSFAAKEGLQMFLTICIPALGRLQALAVLQYTNLARVVNIVGGPGLYSGYILLPSIFALCTYRQKTLIVWQGMHIPDKKLDFMSLVQSHMCISWDETRCVQSTDPTVS
jgi:hypothetical protein